MDNRQSSSFYTKEQLAVFNDFYRPTPEEVSKTIQQLFSSPLTREEQEEDQTAVE